jgi:hypothetical protein
VEELPTETQEPDAQDTLTTLEISAPVRFCVGWMLQPPEAEPFQVSANVVPSPPKYRNEAVA